MDSKIKEKVELDKLSEFFNVFPLSGVGGLILSAIIGLGISEQVPNNDLWIWFAAVAFCFVIQLALSRVFLNKFRDKRSVPINLWYGSVALACATSGFAWGLAFAYFYPQLSIEEKPYFILVFIVAFFCYFPALMNYLKFFSVFAIALMTPFIYTIGNAEVPGYWLTVILVFGVMMILFSSWSSKRAWERIVLQHELFAQNKVVEAANESKSQFLASASHDLRQPLQALGFYIVMLSDFLREPKKKALFDKTLKAYQALENLLNQLLNISKLNANLIELNEIDFSVKSLFENLQNDYELQAADKGLTVRFLTEDVYVYSDTVCVERVLRNLIENALKYTEHGQVTVCCEVEGESLRFSVKDTGLGIESKDIEKIFDEFYQVKNPERDRSKGFGLGLYAVSKLVALLGSRINVKSLVGKGSEFSLFLPLGKKPIELDYIKSEKSLDENLLFEKVVMLVEDDEVVLDSISRLFLSWDCLVLTANSYEEAIDLIKVEEIEPDFLLVDFRLPNYKNGVDLVSELRGLLGSEVPALVLTGDTGAESLNELKQSGLSFLNKPADPKQLKIKVVSILERALVLP